MRSTTLWLVVMALMVGSSMPTPAMGVTATLPAAPLGLPITGDCSNGPCDGACAVCPPCPPGVPCPEGPCLVGQCQMVSGACICAPGVSLPTPTAAECDQNCAPGSRCGQFPCGLETVQGVCESSGSTCVCVPPPCVSLTPTPIIIGIGDCGASCDSRPCKGQCADGSVAPGFCTALTIDQGCACAPVCGTPVPTPPSSCNAVPCDGPCTLPIPCPLGVPCPIQLGQCEMSTSGACECVPVVPTPPATPTPQCNAVPCGGDCTISFPCPNGAPCPEVPARLGQCASTSSGQCECVPIGPTPMPTPTPQCSGAACSGPCTIWFPPPPCTRPGMCDGPEVPVLSGQCEMTASGDCACVPVSPTPTATPTPQCTGGTCDGPCTIAFPCPPNVPCPDLVQLGQCEASATGGCECVPPTPAATPTPECGSTCEGRCVISFPPFPCPPGKQCNGPDVPVLSGQCELNESGDCECVPATPAPSPTPMATATPQCDVIPCGGQCVISPPCLQQGCELPGLLGTCETVSGGCTCVPATPLPGEASNPNARVLRLPHHRRSLRPRLPAERRS